MKLDALHTVAPGEIYAILTEQLPWVTEADLCENLPALLAALPELSCLVGFDQRSPHHAYDAFTHTAKVVAAVPADPVLRWAALLHDCAKPDCFTLDETGRGHMKGHAPAGARKAEAILTRLGAPEAVVAQVSTLIGAHMLRMKPDRDFLKQQLEALGPQTLKNLLALQWADMNSKGTGKGAEQESFRQTLELLEALPQPTAFPAD